MTLVDTEQRQTAVTLFEFIKKLAEISALLGALLFLVGWSYLYGYYSGFGLSADDMGFSVDNVLVHALPVIVGSSWYLRVAIVIIVLLVAYFGSTKRLSLLQQPGIVLLLVMVAAAASSTYASGIGRDNARRDYHVSTSTLPYVTLEGPMDGGPTSGCSLEEANYRLLLRSSGHITVVLPIDNRNMTASNLRVCIFPESRIQAVRIQVGIRDR
ncbi:MAG: hypothetical protein ABSG23_15990 [Terriglobales bacterium]|jgi:hypothetical protein